MTLLKTNHAHWSQNIILVTFLEKRLFWPINCLRKLFLGLKNPIMPISIWTKNFRKSPAAPTFFCKDSGEPTLWWKHVIFSRYISRVIAHMRVKFGHIKITCWFYNEDFKKIGGGRQNFCLPRLIFVFFLFLLLLVVCPVLSRSCLFHR